ncbi:hypothetical protein BC939DRAFT_184370 [Gamsiella multidivaricata]|uniref:uncharacterized protein n=1 Tax=Gamsiella multidivaricata TaxID=101098 RepID=UPI00221E3881|nr:uncharacterized protein BC939DRAFT_184370 [Gamsiella multidivaricata]KAI7831371.1 hypothetical protein BC939DRAFT_184370 [Gamsiella multidivaricata]
MKRTNERKKKSGRGADNWAPRMWREKKRKKKKKKGRSVDILSRQRHEAAAGKPPFSLIGSCLCRSLSKQNRDRVPLAGGRASLALLSFSFSVVRDKKRVGTSNPFLLLHPRMMVAILLLRTTPREVCILPAAGRDTAVQRREPCNCVVECKPADPMDAGFKARR